CGRIEIDAQRLAQQWLVTGAVHVTLVTHALFLISTRVGNQYGDSPTSGGSERRQIDGESAEPVDI
ncbi:MAG: hypothetical protein ACI8W7_003824, partial [Gammaproteobacteria bacterium]